MAKVQLGESTKDFFYSKSLGMHVALDFLKVDERVLSAATLLGINLSWDDLGRVNYLTYTDARRLLDKLGSHLLTPSEYWQVYNEATEQTEVLEALQSDTGTEWLDVIFTKDENSGKVLMYEHPTLTDDGLDLGKNQPQILDQPAGRPGWFAPKQNINPRTGMPLKVTTTRAKGTPEWSRIMWKYWSTFKTKEVVAGIRGFVTSSGTPSLDLDIPINAHQPVLYVRECRSQLLTPDLDPKLVKNFVSLEEVYANTFALTPGVNNPAEHNRFYSKRNEVISFFRKHFDLIRHSKSKDALLIKERAVDMLGILRSEALYRSDHETLTQLTGLTTDIFPGATKAGSYERFLEFVISSRDRLKKGIEKQQRLVFVVGHRNPDTDTAISALFEAYRQSFLDPDTVFIPILQAERIPDEIARLIGPGLTKGFITFNEEVYQKAERLGLSRWILVDHNKSLKQRFAISIVDHHILSQTAKKQEIPKTWEMIGSCTAQVYLKLLGMGIDFDQKTAAIIHGATLMDTENRGPKKMTYRDKLLMDWLMELSGKKDEGDFYQDLMSHLLNTDDPKRLFERDYKEDWGIFGFAVAKVKRVFDQEGRLLKPGLVKGLVTEAEKNNKAKHFCMTLIKLVDYEEDNQKVNREKVFLVFNDFASAEFRKAIGETLEFIIRGEFGKKVQVRRTEDSIEFWGIGDQLSRKVTAPEFEAIVAAFNEFYYSPATGLYIKREFLKVDEEVKQAADELGLVLFTDKEGRICNITYDETKKLLGRLGYGMLSLPEYWQVLAEVNELHDVQMQEHLHSKGFVEFLDTVIEDSARVVNHPETDDPLGYKGKRDDVEIPTALPALIYPNEIDPKSGFPTKTYESQERYSDPNSWRYWSPDAKLAIPTRGYIFLLDKPALDCKIHPDDALPNLGIRITAKSVRNPKIILDKKKKTVKIHSCRGSLLR